MTQITVNVADLGTGKPTLLARVIFCVTAFYFELHTQVIVIKLLELYN